ncbi:MAG: DUF2061 domain-containing protein [Chitinophagales bacterium]|nr:DUF2061 domain-containing protein [Chitinophagales bacterium]
MSEEVKTYQKESHYRSIIKGISWRIIGTLDTMVLSYLVTGRFGDSLKIGFTEVFTKIALYWLHERIWQYFLVGKEQSRIISIVKAISWRLVGSIDTMLISWFYTGSIWDGFKIASFEVVTKMILYYFHEQLWLKIPKGSIRRIFGK